MHCNTSVSRKSAAIGNMACMGGNSMGHYANGRPTKDELIEAGKNVGLGDRSTSDYLVLYHMVEGMCVVGVRWQQFGRLM